MSDTLKKLIKEEIKGVLEGPKSPRLRPAPESQEDWLNVHQAAGPHLEDLLNTVAKLISDEADSLEDILDRRYGMSLSHENSQGFLTRELISRLKHKKR